MDKHESFIDSAAQGDLSQLQEALVLGIDPNCRDESDRTALHWACQEGHLEIVRSLIEAGADINSHDNGGFTPLVTAVGEGHLEISAELLKGGASPNARVFSDGNGTALHTACAYNHLEIVRLLIDVDGIDINLRDDDGMTPLGYARKHTHLEIEKLLLKRNAR